MRRKRDRVIIDTNIWISYLISNEFSLLDNLIQEHSILLIFSNELLEEFYEVARRKIYKIFYHRGFKINSLFNITVCNIRRG